MALLKTKIMIMITYLKSLATPHFKNTNRQIETIKTKSSTNKPKNPVHFKSGEHILQAVAVTDQFESTHEENKQYFSTYQIICPPMNKKLYKAIMALL